ncbi:helix-turn-helix domain-containing protein [Fusobacterium polymorphum]|uniref:HTH cro/C1-type domain-containing protein n=1 Tax=Fusobacterium nucleatum subsp. polymorphum TaxID=76857 RepID=A0A2C6BJM6_FUSNP|nr:helix-turn-helix transcriptional regulator [Fusobacterium polymorphum]PHI04334.1 hypothetical protein CBG52_11270 [Fusobacterium polymorphum]
MKSIGERIREERQKIGYTLEKLANEIGVTPSTILKYENGSINIPSDKIEKLSVALKTTPAYLMGWTEAHEVGHALLHSEDEKVESPRFRWVARNAKKMTDEELGRLQKLMEVAFSEIDFDEED